MGLELGLQVALGEYDTGWRDPAMSIARASALAVRAAQAGARLVVLPEMCTTGFCMEVEGLLEPAQCNGPAGQALGALARENDVWILAGLALAPETGAARATNAAVVFDSSGRIAGVYRKQRLFAYAGEDAPFMAGDSPLIVAVDGVRLCPLICYELRFPELFRDVATDVDAFVVIANWPAARRGHWDALLRARAIENQSYVVGVNRTGHGGDIAYNGGSAVYDPWGDRAETHGAACVFEIDPGRVSAIRHQYPFLRDMRIGSPPPPVGHVAKQ